MSFPSVPFDPTGRYALTLDRSLIGSRAYRQASDNDDYNERTDTPTVRYLGNKTKLLPFIGEVLDDIGVQNGRAVDAFAGTATVGSYLKSQGFDVDSCDVMTFSYVLQRAYIVADAYPIFKGLSGDREFHAARSAPEFAAQVESRFRGQADLFRNNSSDQRHLEEVLLFLDTWLEPRTSFITSNYSTSSDLSTGTRMYFTRENGRRIDAIRHRIEEWRGSDSLTDDEYYILLAALLEAADAVANTTGVYAAFVKTWQGNALRRLQLPLMPLVVGTGRHCHAHRGDVNDIIAEVGHVQLLYLDPPYNTRQYSGYYHVPELIAQGWFDEEPQLRGKTGLIPDEGKKSEWSTQDGCVPALEGLIEQADAEHVLLSYNNEGIIPEREIERIFTRYGVAGSYRRVGKNYKRYRSDSDSDTRRYSGDRVTEFLYYVNLK